jgi:polyphosphate kinase
MCSLRPGRPGISEKIRVRSIVDRYLEHARMFIFENAGDPIHLLSSADWMTRNFDRRVELAFPVLDPQHQARMKEILDIQLNDNAKSWSLQSDGSYLRVRPDGAPHLRAQEKLYEIYKNGGVHLSAKISHAE